MRQTGTERPIPNAAVGARNLPDKVQYCSSQLGPGVGHENRSLIDSNLLADRFPVSSSEL